MHSVCAPDGSPRGSAYGMITQKSDRRCNGGEPHSTPGRERMPRAAQSTPLRSGSFHGAARRRENGLERRGVRSKGDQEVVESCTCDRDTVVGFRDALRASAIAAMSAATPYTLHSNQYLVAPSTAPR